MERFLLSGHPEARKPLYRFEGGSTDGESPVAGLINVNGTLYSTTMHGGPKNAGTVFWLTP